MAQWGMLRSTRQRGSRWPAILINQYGARQQTAFRILGHLRLNEELQVVRTRRNVFCVPVHIADKVSLMSGENQRDRALAILQSNLSQLSILFKECYLSSGRGAVTVYARDVIDLGMPNKHDYRRYEETLAIFDSPLSQSKLKELIDKYHPLREGIMALITDHSNATYFITVKLK